MKVIVISGHAGHGKDTAAKIIAKELESKGQRVLITHYADLLKYICKTFFGWNGKKDRRGRNILQHVGTDIIRRKSPDFAVNFIVDILRWFGEKWDCVLIPDARFPNEIEVLKQNGFDVTHIRITRNNIAGQLTESQKRHPSETALDYIEPDRYIRNDGTIRDLIKTIKKDIKENAYGSH